MRSIIICLAVLCLCSPAHALKVNYNSPINIWSIDDFVVDGYRYNIHFISADIKGVSSEADQSQDPSSELADSFMFHPDIIPQLDQTKIGPFSAALVQLLDAESDIDNGFLPTVFKDKSEFQLPFMNSSGLTSLYMLHSYYGIWDEFGQELMAFHGEVFSNQTVAVATPVPEPATILLLGSGLIGAIGYGRKKFKFNP
ncbi:MAG: PEP-CTERM sorting domain-containing protein [Desulfobacterales bacterium]|jgi:hypothetical protein